MLLKVILPHQILLEQDRVTRVVVETKKGSLGILPRRLDCVSPLSPGILIYETIQGEQYLAIGVGILTKIGPTVSIAVSKAIHGDDLLTLKNTVELQFIQEDEREKDVRTALAKLESAFARHFLELKRYG